MRQPYHDLPDSMTVIDIIEPGGPEKLQPANVILPPITSGHLLVKVVAAGVNRPDVFQRKGAYPPPPDASPIPGLEVSGIVVAIADDVTEWEIGDKICGLVAGGGYAEYCLVHQDIALPLGNLSFIEAAAIPENFFTVWANMFQLGKLQAGETVLIHGGTSGIGSVAIMLAKAFGAQVITTVGSAEKVQIAQSIGADHAINYHDEDFVARTLALTRDKGVNMVIDLIGGDYIAKNYAVAAKFGRIIQIGMMKGNPQNLNMMPLMVKRLTHTGSTMRSRNIQEKSQIAQQIKQQVWPLVQQGKIQPIINKTYPLDQAADAHRFMESGDLIGKIVLVVDTHNER
ncbi:NAD(P)H-quinone oxidoreductase [Moellerella wisconsensis]|uniref:NAD(P)H-quinone oxidoreductase n=2 Tax=Moellerella wisconsensis TaxID=158849 RepID=A0ACD3YB25_9GAMM|nr:NAD(P)H-quinone oxidoreductase [Moellerella wisconsensis]KLN98076.1 zinc-binding dehydrogenase [Moellerella wisconsensis]UNH25571.1 NAD(P)H-quinone oxidoreductase [Moellerella wisconsensis]UNH25904.1 NAD(P)H-quinone oxidoreductase [Moellerella wisconsensis]UNH29357.1 NAD(P)H-quinone oxidoreductase [Moellerella wisconsensis]UNH40357.1 NAD(P)H-quinone oxidoreductase [Moellerella wisconsensis]